MFGNNDIDRRETGVKKYILRIDRKQFVKMSIVFVMFLSFISARASCVDSSKDSPRLL